MSRSFISSSSWAIAVLAMLAATELLLRVPAVSDAGPIRTHLREPGAVVRLQALERVRAQYGRVDVLFVGSSVVRCNIRPLVFDQLLNSGGRSMVSFNAGLSGLWPDAVRLYLEDLWLTSARPRVVVQGIRYGELFPSPRARDYSDIASGVLESAWEDRTVIGRLKALPFEHLRLLQYRGIWPTWLLRYSNGNPGDAGQDELRIYTDPRGWTPRTPTLDVVRRRHMLDKEQPNPAIDVAKCRNALDQIRRSARAARRAGAEYVLVNVPEHAFRWSGPDGRERYRNYLDTLRALAAREGVAFVDVTGGDPAQFSSEAEYSDYHHMSPAGADRFTRLLAQEFRKVS
jgi:hypothetical protein